MQTGLAGAPTSFTWRGRTYSVTELLDRRKFTRGDAHNASREKYLKREYFTVRLDDGSIADLYIERQPRPGASPSARKQRWFIYTRTAPPKDERLD